MKIKDINKIIPILSYNNPYENRKIIYKDTRNKTGIYLFTHVISGKSYVGSTSNLSRRIRNYFSLGHLKSAIKKNNSQIYNGLLNEGYSKFKLSIIEFCELNLLLSREQYYLNNYKLEYNTLRVAGSMLGFRHSESAKYKMQQAKLGKICHITTKIKLSKSSRSFPIIVNNIKTKETYEFCSIRNVAKFINIHYSGIAKSIKRKGYYKNNNFLIKRI